MFQTLLKTSITFIWLLFIGSFIPNALNAQTIKGKILDDENEQPINEVVIGIESTKIQVITDINGDFEIQKSPVGEQTLIITADGYEATKLVVIVPAQGSIVLTPHSMNPKENGIEEGLTEIPTISISIDDVASDNDQAISGLLSASRDAFLSAAAFTFGPARFRIRGYDSENTDIRLNGITFNSLENGRPFWGAWGGLNDVFRNRETDLGLQSSSISFGGVGGSSQIDLRASKQRQQLKGSYSISNRTYRNRLMLTYSSGKLSNGWSYSLSGSKRWADEGYVEATSYDAWSYFAGVEKELNSQHALGLTVFGAPSKRGRRTAAVQEMNEIADNNWYNPYWGLQSGEKRNSRISKTHLPTGILQHTWTLTNHSSLNSSASFQKGKSGSTALDWNSLNDPRPDYYRNLPSFQSDPTTAAFILDRMSTSEALRQINWDRLYNINFFSDETITDVGGIEGNDVSGKRSQVIVEDRRYDPTRIGFSSTFQDFVNDQLTLSGGIQYRSEKQETYKLVDDLLGGEFYVDIDKFATNDSGTGNDETQNDLNRPNRILSEGDRFGYDYDANINNASLWAQGEYSLSKVDLFLAGNISQTNFWRTGNVINGKFPDDSFGDSEKQDFFNYGAKGGATYKIDGRNYVYANAGYLTRAPFFRNSFVSPRTRNQVVPGLTDEKVASVEGGYLLRSPNVKARATAYYTTFKDQTQSRSFFHDDLESFVNYSITGIEKEHKGIELAVEGKVNSSLTLTGVASLGQYIHTSRPVALTSRDDDAEVLDLDTIFAKNFYVPGTPQTALTGGINYRGKEFWFANLNFNYFNDIWIDFNPVRRTKSAVEGTEFGSESYNAIIFQENTGSAFTMDFFGGKSFKINDNFLYLNIGVSNILNKEDFRTGGYEQLRYNFDDKDPDTFKSKYFYSFGSNYFINLSFRH